MLLAQHDPRLIVPTSKQADILSPFNYPGKSKSDLNDPRFIHASQVGSPGNGQPDIQFNNLAILDTASKRPLVLTRFRAIGGRLFFQIFNNLNQSVVLTYVGGNWNDAAGAPDIAAAGTIAANSTGNISTNVWNSWVGVRASASVAPTTGGLTVYCTAERDPNNPY